MTTDKEREVLLPCPFCWKGNPAISFECCDPPREGDHSNTIWTITCWNCSAEITGYDSELDLIVAWNTRAAQDTALVEALQNIAITAQQASLHDPEQFCSWAYDRATQALAQHQQKE